MRNLLLFLFFLGCGFSLWSQKQVYDPELNQYVAAKSETLSRSLRYKPDGSDFVIMNGKKKFNRALYGTNTGFRVETGDVPEFALYLPRMGGNLSFSLERNGQILPLNDAEHIESRYRPGSRIYTITDPVLSSGSLKLTVLAMGDAEGLILKIETQQIPSDLKLCWTFGGAADKRFSREGDLGVDPEDCFDLKPEYCKGNQYFINRNAFTVVFGAKQDKKIAGVFPEASQLHVETQETTPVLKGKIALTNGRGNLYMALQVPDSAKISYPMLTTVFDKAEASRQKIASQLQINTPDSFMNTLGATLAIAADGIWSGETWLHGAVGWRMPLSGWRAAYAGDALGWHDRARKHFDAYADSQVRNVAPVYPHPTQDSAMNLARAEKKWGTQMYSNGYICRNPHENNKMHHYDMNLCYIDELLWHLQWTGDMEYARKIWPVIESSLAWEKRNYDPDDDGLYDAYCCIWASDGLYYNSGAVTHSSAYNYRANKIAAEIARRIGKNAQMYADEAAKILHAMNNRLWISSKGHWAEFQDFMGEKRLHESAALWTIYHAIDSETQNPFQGYQATRYVDTEIPHIPVTADGLTDDGYYTLSTSNWMPYCWSTNNVVTAEVLHTTLAYWMAGRNEKAYKLFKSTILDAMYLGSSPGNVSQISFYDAARGECYRDFGDPIGVMSRALVQGMFGILPDALNGTLIVRPGFPASWEHASIVTPDINFAFKRNGFEDTYNVTPSFKKKLFTELQIKALYDKVASVTVNGKAVKWDIRDIAGDYPVIAIPVGYGGVVCIHWGGSPVKLPAEEKIVQKSDQFVYSCSGELNRFFDPQGVLCDGKTEHGSLTGTIVADAGHHTLFVEKKQGEMTWWQPVNIEVKAPVVPVCNFNEVNTGSCETVNIDKMYNDSVGCLFKHKYLTPRSPYTTLQIPLQGIGEWCHPTQTATIDDEGLRQKVRSTGILNTNLGVPFRLPSAGKNVIFTSLWDNFPAKVEVPLKGKASHAYLLMVGSTNQMQSRFINGRVIVQYADGSADTLNLVNPDNWCPVEQDYYVDGKAFTTSSPRPYRLHLKTGKVSNELDKELNIKGVYGRKIEGGAAVLLDMKLNPEKKLKYLCVQTAANEVIVGLMGLTLQR